MMPSNHITGIQRSTAAEQSLGLQRLAAVCPDVENLREVYYLPVYKPGSKKSGFKLSWPKEGDKRRAVVTQGPMISSVPLHQNERSLPKSNDARIINVTSEDLEVQYRYTASNYSTLQIPSTWNARILENAEQDLIEYFQSVASRSLSTFGQDPVKLGQILLRIAFAGDDNTSSRLAAQQSLLAFSSAHRHNVHSRGTEYKIAAIKALSDLSGREIGITEAVQHVAAGMLLCAYEMQHSTCTTGHWLIFLCGTQDIIQITGLDTAHDDPDLVALLDWVYYHNALARFSRQHWHRKEFTGIQIAPMRLPGEIFTTETSPLAYIELLSEMCDGAVTPAPSRGSHGDLTDHQNYLKILDWKIRNLPVTTSGFGFGCDVESKLELYRLAMLIYLNRASEDTLRQAARTQQHVDQGFSILSKLGFCDHQFPVFILGCEARGDGEREEILRLIQRTEDHGTCRAFNYVKRLLEAFWAQKDLASGGGRDLKYWDQLSDVMSRCAVLPTFA
ncbi:hypothetical protein PG995_004422 [Apiospora arundinis]